MQHSNQHGFTLVELMVVVAILGTLAASATVLNRQEERIDSVAHRISGALGLTSRRAVAGGAVTLSPLPARSQLILDNTQGRGIVSVEVLRPGSGSDLDADGTDDLYDSDATGGADNDGDGISDDAWEEVSRIYMSRRVEIFAIALGATNTAGGASPANNMFNNFEMIRCAPDGSCEAATIYLQTTTGAQERYRIVVLPLSSTPLVLPGW